MDSNHNDDTTITRRTVIGMLAASAGVSTFVQALPLEAAVLPAAAAPVAAPAVEVLSFFMDLPYIDKTGTAEPYHPARGYARQYPESPADGWMPYC